MFYLMAILTTILTYCKRQHLQRVNPFLIFGVNGATDVRVFIFSDSIEVNRSRLLDKIKAFEETHSLNDTLKNDF